MRRIVTVAASIILTATVMAPGMAQSGPPTEQDATPPFLMRSSDARDVRGIGTVRELGFGWVSVQPRSGAPQPSVPRGAHTDTWYQLVGEPLAGDQWHLANTGQTGGTPGADIDADVAWSWSTGGGVIAIIDSGWDSDHPDLVDRAWVNSDEIPDNGIDDDDNGFVDDVSGWDFVDDDPVPEDVDGHGTAVAGAAAASLNGVGGAGVAPGASIMAVRACFGGSCALSAIVAAIAYAVDNGATVINLSLGSHTYDAPLADAVAGAVAAGVPIVAAAGNDGADIDEWPFYPASLPSPGVVSVAATDHDDQLAAGPGGSTNVGVGSVDLAAPGEAILTTTIGGWGTWSGTSLAAPQVAGAIAIVSDLRPVGSVGELTELILTTVDVRSSLAGAVATGGRLNAGRAALVAASTPFVDTTSSVFRMDIAWLSARGFTKGCNPPANNRYCPDDPVTRGQIAAFLARALDLQATPTDHFTDDDTSIFEHDIDRLAAAGIAKGCNPPANDRYCPDDPVTRGQIAAFLARALG